MTELSALRKKLKALPDLDVNITFLPFFIKAASNSLRKYPIINSSIDEKCENIIYWKQHNIGVAMATNQGLAVPVIKNVENLTILEIAQELQRLIESGKNGTFSPSDLNGATFSISNIGIVSRLMLIHNNSNNTALLFIGRRNIHKACNSASSSGNSCYWNDSGMFTTSS